jgi:hypothetical protein
LKNINYWNAGIRILNPSPSPEMRREGDLNQYPSPFTERVG